MPDPPYTIIADPWLPKNKVVFMSIDPALNRPAVSWFMIDEVEVWGDVTEIAEIERRLLYYEEQLVKAESILGNLMSGSTVYQNQYDYIQGIHEKILEHRVRLPGIDC